MTSTAIVTINVLDTQDSSPVFVGTPYFGFVYEVSVPVSMTLFHIYIQYIFLQSLSFYGNVLSFCLCCVQGSEIFTVFAKDGDQNSPNPIHYSILNGQLRLLPQC